MDRTVFTDGEVRKLMRQFVAVRLDPVLHKRLAATWEVQEVPSFVVIRPDGSVGGKHDGKMTAEEFRFFLINHVYY